MTEPTLDPWQSIDGRCNAHKTDGTGLCRNKAGKGTNHRGAGQCFKHGGRTPNGVKHGERLLAERAVERLDLTVVRPRDAADVLLEEVARSAAIVDFITERIRDLDPQALVQGVREIRETTRQGQPPERVTVVANVPNVWLNYYLAERKHLVFVCKETVSAGVQLRQVELAEQQGRIVVRLIDAVLGELGVDVSDGAVAATVARHLRLVG
jgi:hypothetical protein